MLSERSQQMTLDEVVEHYVQTRTNPQVSTCDAMRAIRAVLPSCPLSDRELADLVARHAVRKGYTVSFDGNARDKILQSLSYSSASWA